MSWFSYQLCKGFIMKTCEQCVNLNQCAQLCSFCVTFCPSLEFDPSQDWSKCFCLSGCILFCFEVSYQNLLDPISEIAFSRFQCESLFRYIGSDWLKSDIGPSESPNADELPLHKPTLSSLTALTTKDDRETPLGPAASSPRSCKSFNAGWPGRT
jgi:hypothetical protein